MSLNDYYSAAKEAKKAPSTLEMQRSFITSSFHIYADNSQYERLTEFLKEFPNEKTNRDFLEEISWGVLEKGVFSPQYMIQLTTLLGSFFTKDAKAISFIQKMMRNSHAMIRSVAIQLACVYRDTPLKKEILQLYKTEKDYHVRLELLKSIGKMQIAEKKQDLHKLLANKKSSPEEKQIAITSLVELTESIDMDSWNNLATSKTAAHRKLACHLAYRLDLKGAKDKVLELLKDHNPDVKISALSAVALAYKDQMDIEKLTPLMQDPYDSVAITASWLGLTIDQKKAEPFMEKWIEHNNEDSRLLAASAIKASGSFGVKLAVKHMQKSKDPYVRLNLALGLLGQNIEEKKALNEINLFLKQANKKIMSTQNHPVFSAIVPSLINYEARIPNYPQALDLITRLELLSTLALKQYEGVTDSMKEFLSQKTWGISATAAALLLQEGDEQTLEVIRSLLTDKDVKIRVQAALVLAMVGKDRTVIKTLQEAYREADHDMKMHILEALGQISDMSSVDFFLEVFHEPFLVIQLLNASALLQCLNH